MLDRRRRVVRLVASDNCLQFAPPFATIVTTLRVHLTGIMPPPNKGEPSHLVWPIAFQMHSACWLLPIRTQDSYSLNREIMACVG